MPTGDILNRFAQHSQSITGGAPVETYEQGEKRMRELDQKLIRLRRNTPCFSYGDIRRLCLTFPYASL